MSGGDGKNHNSGAHATGGVNGTSGKGGPSSGGGVDASDHSGWSSENNPWGGGIPERLVVATEGMVVGKAGINLAGLIFP
ncbi:hypothetical protein H0K13_004466 [Salmonella enterica]|uniref:hypothetical protein n=1 Tax=Salmonella enterica TaxID=28901 RepID=UPI001CDEBCF7|nr:hypothetical protein [Salmonella enterica]HBJ6609686.1 hypothetical protein [Salmonella enterica subsp. enterica serovar 6,8:d:-]EGN6235298.1 hypothetical protein [Salmonella enterica]EGS2411227.1 hypothetical protein [Salmonella enterica]EGS2992605.1 hypothetical protein [Salmonella enterica]